MYIYILFDATMKYICTATIVLKQLIIRLVVALIMISVVGSVGRRMLLSQGRAPNINKHTIYIYYLSI